MRAWAFTFAAIAFGFALSTVVQARLSRRLGAADTNESRGRETLAEGRRFAKMGFGLAGASLVVAAILLAASVALTP
jgi:hypothetical protein